MELWIGHDALHNRHGRHAGHSELPHYRRFRCPRRGHRDRRIGRALCWHSAPPISGQRLGAGSVMGLASSACPTPHAAASLTAHRPFHGDPSVDAQVSTISIWRWRSPSHVCHIWPFRVDRVPVRAESERRALRQPALSLTEPGYHRWRADRLPCARVNQRLLAASPTPRPALNWLAGTPRISNNRALFPMKVVVNTERGAADISAGSASLHRRLLATRAGRRERRDSEMNRPPAAASPPDILSSGPS